MNLLSILGNQLFDPKELDPQLTNPKKMIAVPYEEFTNNFPLSCCEAVYLRLKIP
jgi:hypothetical protein